VLIEFCLDVDDHMLPCLNPKFFFEKNQKTQVLLAVVAQVTIPLKKSQ
jgi:hypothetical protein